MIAVAPEILDVLVASLWQGVCIALVVAAVLAFTGPAALEATWL